MDFPKYHVALQKLVFGTAYEPAQQKATFFFLPEPHPAPHHQSEVTVRCECSCSLSMRLKFTVTKIHVLCVERLFCEVLVMDSSEPGPSGVMFMSRNDIYNIMKSSSELTFAKKLNYMELHVLNMYAEDIELQKSVKHKLSRIKSEFKSRWEGVSNNKETFEHKYESWLKGITSIALPTTTSTSRGRHEKEFAELSDRSKRRKTEQLRSNEIEVLHYATQMKLRSSGNAAASNVLKDLITSPNRAKKYKSAYRKSNEEILKLSPLAALTMYVEAGLSRSQYDIVRASNPKIYPCYSILQIAKKECYPPTESLRVTATCAEVDLQSLLDHTTSRLLESIKDVVDTLKEEEKQSLELICKWGCDGTTQPQYKMKFQSETDSDANIFQSSMVPLQIICGQNKKVVWQNPTPSSPRYCRPIRIRFLRETVANTKEEIDYIKSKVKNLKPTEFSDTKTKHTMLFTMVDGKVCNAATDTTSTMRCFICGATSSEFNDLSKERVSKEGTLDFGLSTLHARIRFFESLLHIAYKLPIKKWRTNKADKCIINQTKETIQDRFKKEMGLLVDVPKTHFGNTNDGNTSRRFFADPELSASITGIDLNLIYRFKIILEVITSGHKINVDAFKKYAKETEELYVNLYNWHPMTPTVHKVLRHGAEVISKAMLPIGQLSEEAAESRNKHIREYRLNYSRKFSRESCNLDVLNRLLLTSDPLLTGMRKKPQKKTSSFSSETLELLLPGEANFATESDQENEEDKENEDDSF